MKRDSLQGAEKYMKAHRRKKLWYRIMAFLAAVVVFCTTYALILPAVTLEKKCNIPEHTHTDACYTQVGESADAGTLTCTLPENETHTHGLRCYGTWVLTCGMQEHTHSEACQTTKLTEEEQAQVEEVVAMIDTLPASEEIEETAAAFDEAEDENGLETYLSELYPRVSTVYEAYSALTDAQKSKVTNADKLMALEWIWSAVTLNLDSGKLTDDSAYVDSISISQYDTGTAPFDNDDEPGNDSASDNMIVRTFDTVTYNINVKYLTYGNGKTFDDARVKLEFVLPLTAEQAVFDQAAMGWMEDPVLTTENRIINEKQTPCQILTCYKHLLPSAGHVSVVPGEFGENVTVKIKGMKNGDTFAPIFSAAMEYGTWDGTCAAHHVEEKKTITAEDITISAAPKYNVQIGGTSTYKGTFDFNTGNSTAQGYGDGYGIGSIVGRVVRVGLTLQLYNDNASKGFKGIELPNGAPITFDISLGSSYRINTPNSGYTQGQVVGVTEAYMPRLWSCDGNSWTVYGAANGDGRVLNDDRGCADQYAPWNQGNDIYSCYRGGSWLATQQGNTVHVTVSGYQINVDKMPTKNADTGGAYGLELGIGCFSAGELWIVQPFNKIGSTGTNQGPEFDIVKDYGQGAFTTNITAMNMKATTVSGVSFRDSNGTNDAQTQKKDDRMSPTVELTLPGGLQNRVTYSNSQNLNKGVGVDNQRDGLDFGTSGTSLYLKGGFSYNTRNEEDNILYWGTNLTKFYASAIELTGGEVFKQLFSGAQAEMTVLYATKRDGTDWTSDWELQSTYEDDLVFYNSVNAIPTGHKCVGLLYCFKGPGPLNAADPYYYGAVPAKIRDDMTLVGKTYMLASTSRVWTKAMFERAGMKLDNIPDWTNSTTKLSSFPTGCYKSANIDGSVWYQKETYAADGSGAIGTHNSDWCHWGDTLLVIGYKTGITKNLAQQSENTEKNNYNLDADQRIVDFKLQPRTYYDQGSGNHELTTTVTIVDTLPKYLTYRPGSCFFGGQYTQSSVNGGTQGIVTGGSPREPDDIVNNADGTQTLTWIIPNVTVGREMPTIYYSANIGNRNDPNKDVPIGTIPMLNKVRITAPHDMRQPSVTNGNYAESGIAVSRGTASSYGKYSTNTVIEPDGEIHYVIYYDNNAMAPIPNIVMLDTMPRNGYFDNSFTGGYTVKSWNLNAEKCTPSNFTLYYTLDEKYAGKTLQEISEAEIKTWTKADINAVGSVTAMNGTMPAAWALIGTLNSQRSVYIDLTIKLNPGNSNGTSNVYHNAFSHGNTVTATEEHSVIRTLEGLTWMDDNANGVQDSGENHISNVKVSLLKLREGTTFTTNASGSFDAMLYFNNTMFSGLDASNLKKIRISASGIPAGQQPQLFYATNGNPLDEYHSKKLYSNTTAETEYVYDVSSYPEWSGTITALRWDPVDGVYNRSFTIKSITFDLADGSTREFDFTQEGAYTAYLSPNNLSSNVQAGGDPTKEADYVPFAYPDGTEAVITTGKQVSVRTGVQQDYEPGRYKFTDLPAGTFAVKFEDGGQQISTFIASPANRVSDNTIDSDGIATYNSDKSRLEKTVILNITMQKAEDMSVVLYESKYHDSGFYERGYELPNTGGAGTTLYITAGLTLSIGAALLLYYNHRRRRKDVVSS